MTSDLEPSDCPPREPSRLRFVTAMRFQLRDCRKLRPEVSRRACHNESDEHIIAG